MASVAKAPERAKPATQSRAKIAVAPAKAAKPKPTSTPTSESPGTAAITQATLTITSKNYSSWSLRGWLLARFAGLNFEEHALPPDDVAARAEILMLSSSTLVPCLNHGDIKVWDTLAIAEYLNEACPQAQLLPAGTKARAHCRAICGEMHSGFSALRSALPMNLRSHFPQFKVWSRAQADIDRIIAIWRDCLRTYGGPYLFGEHRTIADAMYAPVCTRFATYDVKLDAACQAYCQHMLAEPEMREWIKAAKIEPLDIDELDVEF